MIKIPSNGWMFADQPGSLAETAIWLASAPELTGVTGRSFYQGAEIPCEFRDDEAEERLWEACEQLLGQLEPHR